MSDSPERTVSALNDIETPLITTRDLLLASNDQLASLNRIPQSILNDLSRYHSLLETRSLEERFKEYSDSLLFSILQKLPERQIILDSYVMLLTCKSIEAPVSFISDFSIKISS